MKFVMLCYDSIWLNHVCETFEKLNIFISHLKKFNGVDHKYVINWKNDYFQMKGDKYCEMITCIKFISNVYLDD
jgi:hypothetical protein